MAAGTGNETEAGADMTIATGAETGTIVATGAGGMNRAAGAALLSGPSVCFSGNCLPATSSEE
jgi:hypothetical protein